MNVHSIFTTFSLSRGVTSVITRFFLESKFKTNDTVHYLESLLKYGQTENLRKEVCPLFNPVAAKRKTQLKKNTYLRLCKDYWVSSPDDSPSSCVPPAFHSHHPSPQYMIQQRPDFRRIRKGSRCAISNNVKSSSSRFQLLLKSEEL